MSWFTKASHSLDKQFIGTVNNGKIRIFLVNGGFVRDQLDTDFVWGGHSLAYKFIPDGEIWLERHDSDEHDLVSILAHELDEYIEMKYNHKSYEDAHAMALKLEKLVRRDIPESN